MENRKRRKDSYKTTENERLRKSTKYKEWRLKVFQRDGFRCTKCNSNKNLHPHHLKQFSRFKELRFDINNGQTLCSICHGKIHGINYESNGKVLRCKVCNKTFRPKSGNLKQLCCSKVCGYRYRSSKINPKKGRHYPHLQKYPNKICPICKKMFKATVHKSRNQIYCSHECYIIDRTGKSMKEYGEKLTNKQGIKL